MCMWCVHVVTVWLCHTSTVAKENSLSQKFVQETAFLDCVQRIYLCLLLSLICRHITLYADALHGLPLLNRIVLVIVFAYCNVCIGVVYLLVLLMSTKDTQSIQHSCTRAIVVATRPEVMGCTYVRTY